MMCLIRRLGLLGSLVIKSLEVTLFSNVSIILVVSSSCSENVMSSHIHVREESLISIQICIRYNFWVWKRLVQRIISSFASLHHFCWTSQFCRKLRWLFRLSKLNITLSVGKWSLSSPKSWRKIHISWNNTPCK